MDFVKVFEQTVRDLKREVNLKVLKVPEIEQKVLDATDDEPWGPHGSVLAEIAQATKKFSECQMVMNVIWTRLTETGKNWRLVYKALAVIEYLVAHGSERAVDEIIEHTFQISSLVSFEYVEPSGKDVGINVRKRAETIVSLLDSKDKIQEVRDKAAVNRDKYFGLSSSGITYKSGVDSFDSKNSQSSGRYGGFGNKGDGETFRSSYKDKDQYDEDSAEKRIKKTSESPRYRKSDSENFASKDKPDKTPQKIPAVNVSASKYDEEIDDFDPRGNTSASKASGNTGNNQKDLFSQGIDLLGEPLSSVPADVDLFADANFVSAIPDPGVGRSVVPQVSNEDDLFASHGPPPPVVSSPVDLFAIRDPVPQPPDSKSDKTSATTAVDPFASIPLNHFDATDAFGSFTVLPPAAEPPVVKDVKYEAKPTPAPKKDSFQVKSGIWSDSLSRGLIDLNITAPKKVNLADIGIVGAMSEEKDKVSLPPFYGSSNAVYGAGFVPSSASGPSSDEFFFSSLSGQQNQFGGFQK
ncbi:hypothetical protein M569_05044 [Genlisea aurea]|uniref:ENTH domain-containing protein n=1 Tax=Genlisea aurea TaxID=192259 RepID=S8EAZ8_9LAMI|nr:hypothetical protein M569_05044 [Genlisea aurea]